MQTPIRADAESTPRRSLLSALQSTLLLEHQIACGQLHHIGADETVLALPYEDRSQVLYAALEKYANSALRLIDILERLTEHERSYCTLPPLVPAPPAFDPGTVALRAEAEAEDDPTDLEWDMLLRLSRQLMVPSSSDDGAPRPGGQGASTESGRA